MFGFYVEAVRGVDPADQMRRDVLDLCRQCGDDGPVSGCLTGIGAVRMIYGLCDECRAIANYAIDRRDPTSIGKWIGEVR